MSKKTLSKANLEALGAARLAALLMEVSTGSAEIKRRLRLELSHSLGPDALAHDVRKRLAALRKSTSFVGWRRRKALIKDLKTQEAMIVEKVAPEDPALGFDLLWQFIEIAPSVYGRVDDSKGEIGDVFRGAIARFEEIAPRALLAPDDLAKRVWGALQDNAYGEWDGILGLLAPTLGPTGLSTLKALVEEFSDTPVQEHAEDHEAIRFLRQLRGGIGHAETKKARFVKSCLQQIATAQGDVKAYIDQYSDHDLQRKDISAEVALLLIDDARPEAALEILQNVGQDAGHIGQEAWDNAYIAALSALGRVQDAQDHRWSCFCTTLDPAHLRAYLKLLPDFEDIEAEDRAKAYVRSFPDLSTALTFCVEWPDLQAAAEITERRSDELDGDRSLLLASVANAVQLRHPLAAVLLWRAVISRTLALGQTSRYAQAAEHLAECGALDVRITDYHPHHSHAQYLQDLQTRHDRKTSFWAKVYD